MTDLGPILPIHPLRIHYQVTGLAFSDATSGITDYQYAIGTTSGGIDVKGWTSNTTDTSFTVTGYNLTNAQAYYLSVKAIDMVGHVSDTVTSNGAIADLDAPHERNCD